ncbi:MAG: class I mannose-6-phosphate isomerase, partial [Lachnospiraceae bacterium]|nr:class I mannose-6-phosphate isomerase [Lachnospiraceae bacterium]
VRAGLKQLTGQPFRTVPYFDPGVWGGQWMKKVCGLDPEKPNYAWSFDGVPEENSLYLDLGNAYMEFPAMDLVLYQPVSLLGKKVYSRFGAEFPIRFDFLDTMGGQNLSLQVHPITEYMKKQFGMPYTQDESYYILDAGEDAYVYLGLKENVDPQEMIRDLEMANTGAITFDAEKYINTFPAKKHDHFLIPAGTIHCSGSNAMVLEISATPYIFTFKLWDWSRLGLDGKPRPVHIGHGKQVIQWDRTTEWVKKNLVSPVREIRRDEHVTEERTGLHELEFIETERYWIRDEVTLETDGNFHMLNLIEGKEAVIESPDGQFDPYTVHYAETFIIPAGVSAYKIRTTEKDGQIGVIRACVRS